jgi:hypothetical protein
MRFERRFGRFGGQNAGAVTVSQKPSFTREWTQPRRRSQFDPKLPFTTTLADGRVGWEAVIRP